MLSRRKGRAALLCLWTLAAAGAAALAQEGSPDESSYLPADRRAAAVRSNVCSVCHGPAGVSKWSFVPNLAGQDRDYIVSQLKSLRSRSRADRYAQAAMWGHAANLKDDEIEALADYYAGLAPSKGRSARAATLEAGKAVFERVPPGRPACATCHFTGRSNMDLPRLAGQHADYEARTLREFRAGFRVNPTMSHMASALSDGEIDAVAAYVASLDVPKGGAPAAAASSGTDEAPSAARGAELFRKVGCTQCHGEAGKGGVANPNAQGGLVPALTHVSDGYSDAELRAKIRQGVRYVGKADPAGPLPPLFMPRWGKFLSERDLGDLAAYLESLGKAQKAESW